jgi:hypothetical protein
MSKKESRPGKDGSKQNYHSDIYYRPAGDGSRKKYVCGMATSTGQQAIRRMLGPKSRPGRGSDHMETIDAYLLRHPDTEEMCLLIRESGRTQKYRRNHDNYKFMVTDLEGRGLRVHLFPDTCSGKLDESLWCNTLKEIARFALERKAKTGKTVPILAYSADRFLRNALYKNTTPELLPTRWEYRQVQRLTHGVPLLTWLDPDTPPEKARGLQSKLGQQTKGNKGGGDKMPRWTKRRRMKLQPKARRLHRQGLSYREIAKRLQVSLMTAWKWANRPR